MFKAFYDPSRMWFIHNDLVNSGLIKEVNPEKIRKTACFYSEKINVYIDLSDGRADAFNYPEYTDRIEWVVNDSRGKKFLFFKNWYSPTLCVNMEKVANSNNGKIIPFYYWADWSHFKSYIWPNRSNLYKQNKETIKKFEVGGCFKPVIRKTPGPYKNNPEMSWAGCKWFNLEQNVDTSVWLEHDERVKRHDILTRSNFSYQHMQNVKFKDYHQASMGWKAVIDVPGIANVTHRMFEHGWNGQCIILTKSDVDFPISWKSYYPEVDFSQNNWQEDVQKIISEYNVWGDKIKYYLENYCNSSTITKYFIEKIQENIN